MTDVVSIRAVAPVRSSPPVTLDAASLYVELAPAVLGYLRAQHTPEPEDVLSEVFLQVARDLPRVRGDAAAHRRWVFSIAHNRMIDDARRRAVRPAPADRHVDERRAADGVAPAASMSIDPALVAALHELTDAQREVVVLRFVADLSVRDVARITHQRIGTVKALQHRGLAALARTLAAAT